MKYCALYNATCEEAQQECTSLFDCDECRFSEESEDGREDAEERNATRFCNGTMGSKKPPA